MKEQNYKAYEALFAFLRVAQGDVRLSSTHISLYFVLFGHWLQNDCKSPFSITRRAVMGSAKVSVATYHKCISELHRFGYLTYLPSYHPAKGSAVYLNFQTSIPA